MYVVAGRRLRTAVSRRHHRRYVLPFCTGYGYVARRGEVEGDRRATAGRIDYSMSAAAAAIAGEEDDIKVVKHQAALPAPSSSSSSSFNYCPPHRPCRRRRTPSAAA